MVKQIDNEAGKKVMQFFSSLADETRLRILLSMAEKPKNVNGIYECVGKDKMTLSAISHQLRQLKDLGIVDVEKRGRERVFQLSKNFCWCILRDAFKQFNSNIKIKCRKCEERD